MFIMVGTQKGLFRYQSDDRRHWRALAPVLTGDPVFISAYDPDTETLFAGVNSEFYGPSVRRSRDYGETFDTGGQGLQYDQDDPERVTRVWAIRPAGGGRVYAGVEASGLFRSDDGGDTWREVRALREHPTHETWGEGAGGKCLHTVAIDPFDRRRLYTACSTGGVYRSDDAGASWRPVNRNIRAEHVPDELLYPESGQCVHKVVMSPARSGRMWARSHAGVYRSDDGAETWQAVDGGLPSDFGFPMVGHPTQADRAFVIPLASDMERWFPANRATVYRTDDAGETWTALNGGLPAEAYSVVLRDAFAGDGESPQGLYFGTTSGSVYASGDEGETWVTVAQELPRVLSVMVFPS
jgi:hypothetical protein